MNDGTAATGIIPLDDGNGRRRAVGASLYQRARRPDLQINQLRHDRRRLPNGGVLGRRTSAATTRA
jgi:hypothetical protein